MATPNNKGVYIDAHNDKRGTSHVSFYDRDPRSGSHESIHININSNGTGTIVESSGTGSKTVTKINLKK